MTVRLASYGDVPAIMDFAFSHDCSIIYLSSGDERLAYQRTTPWGKSYSASVPPR